MIGTSLGPYKIIDSLGSGGMGEVYLAEDTRLKRKVAIKVLPAEFASDPERLARFEQEARAAAALNHPHIAAVFDVGQELVELGGGDDGDSDSGDSGPVKSKAVVHYIVQEYLEGQTLGDQINSKGAMPTKKALDLGAEIASALSAAHEAGIVHRDLKPANVFVSPDGHAKVLDFGLAKLTELAAINADSDSRSPTMLGTVAGQVMGTAGYMAPEQVDGEKIDHRADVFAFGCVLYEMATGRRAFAGKNVLDTLHKIANSEPQPIIEVSDQLPVDMQRILRKCLAKEPAARYQTGGDLAVDLRSLAADVENGTALPLSAASASLPQPMAGTGTAAASSGGARGRLMFSTIAAVVAGVALGALGLWMWGAGQSTGVNRFEILLPEGWTIGLGLEFSPDGRELVFSATDLDGRMGLYRRQLEELEPTFITGSGNGELPHFSPDGEWIIFGTADRLRKIPADGGEPLDLARFGGSIFSSWAPGDSVLLEYGGAVYRVSAAGGELETLADEGGEPRYDHPFALDNGHVLIGIREGANWNVGVIVADTGEVRTLVDNGSGPGYLSRGYLTFARDGAVWAQAFDADALTVTGTPFPVRAGVWAPSAGTMFTVAANGSMAYLPGSGATDAQAVVWLDRSGEVAETSAPAPGRVVSPRLSPDGQFIAMQIAAESGYVYTYDVRRQVFSPLRSPDEVIGAGPVWSADGEWVYYMAQIDGEWDIHRGRLDRSSPPERFLQRDDLQLPTDISPDGEHLLFQEGPIGGRDVLFVSLEGGEPQALLSTGYDEHQATFSPNGRWVAFASDESGGGQIYVAPFPGPGRQIQISNDGGGGPVWARDGSAIYYTFAPGALMEAAVVPGSDLEFESPSQVLPRGFSRPRFGASFDSTPDRGFLLSDVNIGASASFDRSALVVVFNWFDVLEQRAPSR